MIRAALPSFSLVSLALAASFVTAFVMATLADASVVWVLLLLLGLATLSIMVWLPELKTPLLALLVFLLPIDISKALTAETTIYGAGLSLSLSDLAFLPLLTIWATEKIMGTEKPVQRTAVHKVFYLQCAWLLFEAWAPNESVGWYLFISNLKCLLYFLILADLARDPRVLRVILISALAGLAAQLTMGTMQFVTGSELHIQGAKSDSGGNELVFEEAGGVHFRRLTGFLPHPNAFSDYLTFALPPIVAVLLLGRRALGAAWIPLIVLGVWALGALTLAMSRGGWIGCGVAILFVLLAGLRSGYVRPRQLATLALCGVFALGVLVAVFPQAIYRITNNDEKSTASRLVLMDQSMLIISKHPIAGVGLGEYNEAEKTSIPASYAGLDPQYRKTLSKFIVHNKYLLTFGELGGIGVLILLLMLWCLIRIPFTNKLWTSPFQYALALGLAGSVVAQSVFFMFEHFSYDVRISMLYMVAGLLVAVVNPKYAPSADASFWSDDAGRPAPESQDYPILQSSRAIPW